MFFKNKMKINIYIYRRWEKKKEEIKKKRKKLDKWKKKNLVKEYNIINI